jgi:hypothetical protein
MHRVDSFAQQASRNTHVKRLLSKKKSHARAGRKIAHPWVDTLAE